MLGWTRIIGSVEDGAVTSAEELRGTVARAVEYAKISAPGADGFAALVSHEA